MRLAENRRYDEKRRICQDTDIAAERDREEGSGMAGRAAAALDDIILSKGRKQYVQGSRKQI